MIHEDFMRQAIALAKENIKNGGGPFGAVIVKCDFFFYNALFELYVIFIELRIHQHIADDIKSFRRVFRKSMSIKTSHFLCSIRIEESADFIHLNRNIECGSAVSASEKNMFDKM